MMLSACKVAPGHLVGDWFVPIDHRHASCLVHSSCFHGLLDANLLRFVQEKIILFVVPADYLEVSVLVYDSAEANDQ
jgi:hypothetical protein